MSNIWTIARREYKLFFFSPIAYVFLFVTLLLLGLFFYLDLFFAVTTQQFVPGAQRTIQLYIFPMLFLGIPVLTMRTIADENRSGTLELLLTAPIHDWELVIGKWLGSLLFFLTSTLVTLVYPLILNFQLDPGIDWGVVISAYTGLILLISTMCAVGVSVSSFFSNPVAAMFASLGMMIIFWIIGSPAQVTGGTFTQVLGYLGFPDHFYDSFMRGIIRAQDVIFYVSMTIFALALGSTSVETRRWR
ncbi:MAG: ABC transporter permease subunit [Anaerolineae bacterium]|nr:ABC transporter permease subunit [Anaerolineae bacterium]